MADHTSDDLVDLDPTPQPITSSSPSRSPIAEERTESTPVLPPRPMSPKSQAKAMLKDAFPDVDETIINAVLIASRGQIEPAFNALLGETQPYHA
jgi:CUE domain